MYLNARAFLHVFYDPLLFEVGEMHVFYAKTSEIGTPLFGK